jgi:hypothetical protein
MSKMKVNQSIRHLAGMRKIDNRKNNYLSKDSKYFKLNPSHRRKPAKKVKNLPKSGILKAFRNLFGNLKETAIDLMITAKL